MAKFTNTGVHIVEGAAAAADTGGESQIWVKNDTPSSLYHTDDAGTDHRINGITLGTAVASTSGTSIDFTGIPAGTKKITVMFVAMSTNGTSKLTIQIGDSGGFETSAYVGSNATMSSTSNTAAVYAGSGFEIGAMDASTTHSGSIVLELENLSAFTWVARGTLGMSVTQLLTHGGSKSLSAELTQVRITTAGGSNTFDAGEINIQFE